MTAWAECVMNNARKLATASNETADIVAEAALARCRGEEIAYEDAWRANWGDAAIGQGLRMRNDRARPAAINAVVTVRAQRKE